MPIFKGCNYKKSHFPILFPVCFLCSPEVWISLISFGIFLHLLELIHGGLDRCVGDACTHFKWDVLLEDDPLEEYIDRCCHRQSHLIQKDFRLALYLFINRYHKEQHRPPEKQSVLKHLREIQERNNQKPPQRQRKKSIDRDSR